MEYYVLEKSYSCVNCSGHAKRFEGDDVLADVIVLTNGKTIVSWRGTRSSIVIHDSLENFVNISMQMPERVLTKIYNR